MQLQNYQDKFLVQDFVAKALESALASLRSGGYSRPENVKPYTTLRFFETSSSDLYLLLVSPVDSRNPSALSVRILTDVNKFVENSRVLDQLNYDVLKTPRDLYDIYGWAEIREKFGKNKTEIYTQLNTILEATCKGALEFVDFE